MKAFVALLLVAAVSGQITTGVQRNVYDVLRNRQLYPQGQYYQRGLAGLYNYGKTADVYGDLTATGLLPSTQQYNIPSDVTLYTLRQLYTLPVFQEYLSLPFFRQYLTVPAFQRYLGSQYFQQYFTQTTFRQFFVDPVLFYKYVYPVVLQFQTGVTGVDQTLVVPEIYRQLVPEVYRYPEIYSGAVPETYRGIVPEVYNGNGYTYETILRKLFEGKVYGNGYVDELLRKIILGQVYGTGVYGSGVYGNTEDVIRRILYPQVYGNGIYGNGVYGNEYYGKGIFGNGVYGNGVYGNGYYGKGVYGNGIYGTGVNGYTQELLRKVLLGKLYGTGVYGKDFYGNGVYGKDFFGNGVYGKDFFGNGVYGKDFFGTGVYGKEQYGNGVYGNGVNKVFGGLLEGNTKGIHYIAPVVFERIFKDLLDGKVTVDELKEGNTGVVGEKVYENKIVDPITGDVKVFTEKFVKPVDSVVEGETNNDILNKIIKKNTFHKL